jgi:hypothetical protein
MRRIVLFGDGITRIGDVVMRLVRGDEVGYADYSEYGVHAARLSRQQGWQVDMVYWEPPDGEIRAFGAGLWDMGVVWVGGDFCGEEEYDGKPVVKYSCVVYVPQDWCSYDGESC